MSRDPVAVGPDGVFLSGPRRILVDQEGGGPRVRCVCGRSSSGKAGLERRREVMAALGQCTEEGGNTSLAAPGHALFGTGDGLAPGGDQPPTDAFAQGGFHSG